jgi:hypothetical protein
VAFLNWRFGLTRMPLWRIEVAPVPDLSNVATPENLSSPSHSLYRDMGMVMMPKKGSRGMCNGQEHGEHKADKARRCSRLVWPVGDRKRDILPLHSAAASRSPRAPGPRPVCAGQPPRTALAENADMVFATSALSTLL